MIHSLIQSLWFMQKAKIMEEFDRYGLIIAISAILLYDFIAKSCGTRPKRVTNA
jgi:hypothetical protein